jgi:ankyrin repeat protein
MLLRKLRYPALAAVCLVFPACTHRSPDLVSLSYRYDGPDNCEGCPAFQVDLHSGGLVDFHGLRGCAVPGLQQYRIPEAKFLELVRAFHDAYFFDIPRLDTKYVWHDVDTSILTYRDARRVHETVDRNRQLPRLTHLEKQFHEAADVDRFLTPSVDLYQQLFASGWDINTLGADHENALISAVDARSLDSVRFLLEHGATASKKALLASAYSDNVEIVKLVLAARKTDMKSPEARRLVVSSARSAEITRFLVTKGADVNSRDPESGETPLIAAVGRSLDNVRFLLSKGADPNATDNSGRSALWSAVVNETNSGFISLLAELGANVNAQDSSGRTALMYASDMCRYWHIKALLAAGADPSIADNTGRTAFQQLPASLTDCNCKISREVLESAIKEPSASNARPARR